MTFRRFISIHTYNLRRWARERFELIGGWFVKRWNKIKERWHLFTWVFKKETSKKATRLFVFLTAVFSSIEQVRAVTYYLDTSKKGGVM